MRRSTAVQAVLLAFASYAGAQDTIDPATDENLLQFKSRPDLFPPRLFVNETSDAVTPGYIFMAPYQSYQNSAAIYDIDGTLIVSWKPASSSNTHLSSGMATN